MEDLNTGFWKAVQDQNEPLRVIHITRNLEDLQADLKEVETGVIRYDALLGFNVKSDKYRVYIRIRLANGNPLTYIVAAKRSKDAYDMAKNRVKEGWF